MYNSYLLSSVKFRRSATCTVLVEKATKRTGTQVNECSFHYVLQHIYFHFHFTENKYCVSTEEWPWPKYPAYLFGGAYLMGRDTVRPLLAAAQTTPFFALEDVYLTGLCTVKANLNVFISEKYFIDFYSIL